MSIAGKALAIMIEYNHKMSMITNAMRKKRLSDKALENSLKPPLSSTDVQQTVDFVFSRIKPANRIGDSGPLLLAKCKSDRNLRYLVKHTYTHCAANEFVYTKLAQAMGVKMPNAVLFQLSENEKRVYFKTEYIIGLKYFDIKEASPTFEQMREQAQNWRDYFRFCAMYDMFLESDSFETPLASDGFIYRVDTSEAFLLRNLHFDMAGVNIILGSGNAKEIIQQYTEEIDYCRLWNFQNFDYRLQQLRDKYGPEAETSFLEPFSLIQAVSVDYIDNFLNTLCYFYPDFISDYFKFFIVAVQEQSRTYLKTKSKGT